MIGGLCVAACGLLCLFIGVTGFAEFAFYAVIMRLKAEPSRMMDLWWFAAFAAVSYLGGVTAWVGFGMLMGD